MNSFCHFGHRQSNLLKRNKCALTSSLVVALSIPLADATESCELVKDIQFDNRTGNYQLYTKAKATADFGTLESNAAAEVRGLDSPGNTWLARNKVGNGHLRFHYPANIASGKKSGLLFDQKFKATDSAVMEYKIKFSEDFVWAAGGKLPGLAGKGSSAGIPVGCTQKLNNIENGFSARLMWRKNGDLVAYTYFPNRLEPRQGNCGIDYKFASVEADQWYTIRQTIQLNTPGEKNGLLKMEIDGVVGLEKTDVEYRIAGKDNVTVNDMLFQTYRGGGETDERFHSPQDDYVYIDDIKVWRDCTNPDVKKPDVQGPEGYEFAAFKNDIISIPQAMNIAYGSEGNFTYLYNQTERTHCTPEVFGKANDNEENYCFTQPVSFDDEVCTTAHSDINTARELFSAQCSTFNRKDCDQLDINGESNWVCSSKDIDDALKYGLPAANGSIKLQAEDYARAKDNTNNNIGGAYRSGRVDIEATADVDGGYNVGWMDDGESLSFDFFNSTSEAKSLELRTAAFLDSALISVYLNGEIRIANQSISYTGDQQTFETIQFDLGNIEQGHNQLQLKIESGPLNVNWLNITPVAQLPEVETPETETPETETPEVETPEVETPEVETPETETPEVEAPDNTDTEVEAPVVEEPADEVTEGEKNEEQTETENPQTPVVENPNSGKPVIEGGDGTLGQPKSEWPEQGEPETQKPNNDLSDGTEQTIYRDNIANSTPASGAINPLFILLLLTFFIKRKRI